VMKRRHASVRVPLGDACEAGSTIPAHTATRSTEVSSEPTIWPKKLNETAEDCRLQRLTKSLWAASAACPGTALCATANRRLRTRLVARGPIHESGTATQTAAGQLTNEWPISNTTQQRFAHTRQ
jgi:hypothetical protein